MGVSKLQLPVKSTTLLGSVIENVKESNVDEVYCVLGSKADSIKKSISTYKVETVINSNYKDGLSSTIICGIQHIEKMSFDAVLIVLGDQPLINSKYFNNLIDTFSQNPEKIIATHYNESYGVPVIVPKYYFSDLLNLKGDKGAKEFLNSHHKVVIGSKSDSLFDVDTKEDYVELMKKLN